MEIESNSLSRNLKGCVKAVLFGATLGSGDGPAYCPGILTDMAKAVVLQACAAAFLKNTAMKGRSAIGEELEAEGLLSKTPIQPGIRGL